MSKKKKLILITTLAIIAIASLIFTYFYFNKSNNLEEPKTSAVSQEFKIVSYYVIDENAEAAKDYYVINENDTLKMYDYYNNLLYEENINIYDNYYVDDDGIYFYKDDKNVKIINNKGNILFNEEVVHIIDEYTNESYYLTNSGLYNDNKELVLSISNLLDKHGIYEYGIYNNLYYDSPNLAYNLRDGKLLFENYDYIYLYDSYAIFESNNKYYLYDIQTSKQIEIYDSLQRLYDVMEVNSADAFAAYKLSKNNEAIYIIDKQITNGIIDLKDNYTVDYTICDNGAKLLQDNNIVIDDCYSEYNFFSSNVIVADSDIYINYKKLESINKDGYTRIFDDYVLNTSYDGTGDTFLIDKKGNLITKYTNVDELGENYYGYIGNKAYFLNQNLDIISSSFNYITCNDYNHYCTTYEKYNNYELYYNNKKLIDNIFYEININNDYIVANGLYNKYVFILSDKEKETHIKLDEKPLNIDINEIVSKYELNDMQDIINENKELFQNYAYIIENNNDLEGYKKYVYDIFKVIIDNKEYLNELYFLSKLKALKIEIDDEYVTNAYAAGLYQHGLFPKISLISNWTNSILYHELMHFVDYSIESSDKIYYECNGSITDEYDANCFIIYLDDSRIIVEGGAEFMQAKYFTKNASVYHEGVTFLSSLEYILGETKVKELFFSTESDYKILKLIMDLGYTYDEYYEMNSNWRDLIYQFKDNILSDTQINSIKMQLIDLAIEIYDNHIKNKNWYEDKTFLFIIKTMIGFSDINSLSKYEIIRNLKTDDQSLYDYYQSLIKATNEDFSAEHLPPTLFITNNNIQIAYSGSFYENYGGELISTKGSLVINYDFENDKVIDYQKQLDE